jgi:Ser/Thr protein kinase RdoA (MazF antagonist)
VDAVDGQQKAPTAMLGPRIAQGRQAEVYAWDGDRAVLKLYRKGLDMQTAEAAALTGLNGTGIAPRLLATVTIDGRAGLILQRIDGVDMLTLLQRQPWRLPSLARTLAHAALRFHQLQAPTGLPDLIEVLRKRIEAAELDTRLREFALRVLHTLPAGDRLCHGDFHPGNTMVTADGVSIIDWPTATRGAPAADFARTMLILRQGEPPPDTPPVVRVLLSAARSGFAKVFARTYRGAAPQPLSNVDGWKVAHAAARLAEGIPAERARLVTILEAAYHGPPATRARGVA